MMSTCIVAFGIITMLNPLPVLTEKQGLGDTFPVKILKSEQAAPFVTPTLIWYLDYGGQTISFPKNQVSIRT